MDGAKAAGTFLSGGVFSPPPKPMVDSNAQLFQQFPALEHLLHLRQSLNHCNSLRQVQWHTTPNSPNPTTSQSSVDQPTSEQMVVLQGVGPSKSLADQWHALREKQRLVTLRDQLKALQVEEGAQRQSIEEDHRSHWAIIMEEGRHIRLMIIGLVAELELRRAHAIKCMQSHLEVAGGEKLRLFCGQVCASLTQFEQLKRWAISNDEHVAWSQLFRLSAEFIAKLEGCLLEALQGRSKLLHSERVMRRTIVSRRNIDFELLRRSAATQSIVEDRARQDMMLMALDWAAEAEVTELVYDEGAAWRQLCLWNTEQVEIVGRRALLKAEGGAWRSMLTIARLDGIPLSMETSGLQGIPPFQRRPRTPNIKLCPESDDPRQGYPPKHVRSTVASRRSSLGYAFSPRSCVSSNRQSFSSQLENQLSGDRFYTPRQQSQCCEGDNVHSLVHEALRKLEVRRKSKSEILSETAVEASDQSTSRRQSTLATETTTDVVTMGETTKLDPPHWTEEGNREKALAPLVPDIDANGEGKPQEEKQNIDSQNSSTAEVLDNTMEDDDTEEKAVPLQVDRHVPSETLTTNMGSDEKSMTMGTHGAPTPMSSAATHMSQAEAEAETTGATNPLPSSATGQANVDRVPEGVKEGPVSTQPIACDNLQTPQQDALTATNLTDGEAPKRNASTVSVQSGFTISELSESTLTYIQVDPLGENGIKTDSGFKASFDGQMREVTLPIPFSTVESFLAEAMSSPRTDGTFLTPRIEAMPPMSMPEFLSASDVASNPFQGSSEKTVNTPEEPGADIFHRSVHGNKTIQITVEPLVLEEDLLSTYAPNSILHKIKQLTAEKKRLEEENERLQTEMATAKRQMQEEVHAMWELKAERNTLMAKVDSHTTQVKNLKKKAEALKNHPAQRSSLNSANMRLRSQLREAQQERAAMKRKVGRRIQQLVDDFNSHQSELAQQTPSILREIEVARQKHNRFSQQLEEVNRILNERLPSEAGNLLPLYEAEISLTQADCRRLQKRVEELDKALEDSSRRPSKQMPEWKVAGINGLLAFADQLHHYKAAVVEALRLKGCAQCQTMEDLVITEPCGHHCLCSNCVILADNCPVCQGPIQHHVAVFSL